MMINPTAYIFGCIIVFGSVVMIYYLYTELWKADWEHNFLLLFDQIKTKNDLVDKYIIQPDETGIRSLAEDYVLSFRKKSKNAKNNHITLADILDRINIDSIR